MLQGPSPGRRNKRKKPQNGRARAQTDSVKPAAYYKTTDQQAQGQAQDDFLDFLGLKPQNPANKSDDTDTKDDGADPFGDDNPFGDDFGATTNSQPTSVTASPSVGDDEKISMESKPKERSTKKKKKRGARARAQTAAAVNPSTTALKTADANGTGKSAVKMKKIDVLPLLHQGIRSNKFKLNGSKSKVRTFYLTANNFYFCWEAVSNNAQTTEKKGGGGLFGKGKGANARNKIDKDRSIPVRSIRNIQKNPAYMMQSYAFIPPQSKAFTLTINYNASGTDKKLNFMAYEPFHHSLFYEGLQQLITAAHDPKRNLSEVFELYVDFPKEILPKHLRPQRFKWEPLADGDFSQQKGQTETETAENGSNMYFDKGNTGNLEVFDPTSDGGRVKSF